MLWPLWPATQQTSCKFRKRCRGFGSASTSRPLTGKVEMSFFQTNLNPEREGMLHNYSWAPNERAIRVLAYGRFGGASVFWPGFAAGFLGSGDLPCFNSTRRLSYAASQISKWVVFSCFIDGGTLISCCGSSGSRGRTKPRAVSIPSMPCVNPKLPPKTQESAGNRKECANNPVKIG